MLRNLDTEAVAAITRFLNKCWQNGKIPRQWKAAKVVMIPKPGKRPELEALRPISLTSCVGKLMEHVSLNRLNNYMERKQLFPHTMIGFRPHLSTQDIMLRLKHEIIDGEQSSRLDTRAILGLDITKAFDNVKHDAVLENMEMLGVGARTHDYIQDFLNDRTAQISIGGAASDDIMLGGRGTPHARLGPFTGRGLGSTTLHPKSLHPRTVHPRHSIPKSFHPRMFHPKTVHPMDNSYHDI
ncbi:hypothetical protein ISCGN_015388 [Ixodes scapularis]